MELLLPGAIIAIAAFFRGVTGFGFALLAALGLSNLLAPEMSAAIILLIDLVLTGLILRELDFSKIDGRALIILLGFGLAGGLLGPFIANALSVETIRIATNIAVALAACVAMIHHPPQWLSNKILGAILAFVVGILMAGFTVGGPLAAAWLLAGGTTENRVRATLAIYFGSVDLLGLVTRFAYGMVPDHFLSLAIPFLVIAVLAFFPGERVYRILSPLVWRRVCGLGLVCIAAIGILQTIWFSL